MNDLIYLSVTQLEKALRDKEVSSSEIVDAYLNRIEQINPKINAVVQITSDEARREALEADNLLMKDEIKGPLHGIPITIKDNIETAGVICTSGTKGREKFIPTEDATVVKRLRDAGAILLGKTNLPELGLAFESDNLIYGKTNNPYNLSYTSGGSSGGEAAIIASGGSPLGMGNDLGGSIRIPSHFCGTVGIKPNSGRFPRTGHFLPPGGVIDNWWQVGPMARFVEDLMLVMPILYGVDWRDPGVIPMPLGDPKDVDVQKLNISFYTDNGIITPIPEIVDTVTKAANALSGMGLNVEESRPPGIEQAFDIFMGFMSADGGAMVSNALELAGTTEVHPLLLKVQEMTGERGISTAEFNSLAFGLDIFRSMMLSHMQKYDVILCPVNAFTALKHGISYNEEIIPAFTYTWTYNLTGWPGAVVRGGTSEEGLPIGVQIVSRPWREDVALAVAQILESELGGWEAPML